MKKYMQKSKKSSKSKPKFVVVIMYGAYAVGKFTVAKELHEQTGFKFFHNHHTVDLVTELFPRGTVSSDRLISKLRFDIFQEIAEAKIDVVTTHAFSATFVSITGSTDIGFVKRIQSIIEKGGGRAYFVHLTAQQTELIKRVSSKPRMKTKKLKDPKLMKKALKKHDFYTPAPVRYNLEIDNTKLSPKKVAEMIKKHFDL